MVELINPFLIRELISWIKQDEPKWWVGIIYSLLMGLFSVTKVYLYRRAIFMHCKIENSLSSVVRQVVFDKILSLPTTSLNMVDFGTISTMIIYDEMILEIFSYFMIIGTGSLIVLIPTISILAYFYGWHFLFAPFWIICLVLIQSFIGQLIKRLSMRLAKLNDKLGLLAKELVQGIKNIKFNVWEDVSLHNTMKIRKGTLFENSIYYLYNFTAVNFGSLIPSCIISSIYISMRRGNSDFNLSEIYFMISLCSTLAWPSVTIVKSINFFVRAKVSAKRISNFLDVEAKQENNTKKDIPLGQVELSDYSASWVDPVQMKKFSKLDPSKKAQQKTQNAKDPE